MEKKTEIIAGEEVPVITAEQPEKKQRKKRADAGMKRGERNEKPAAKKKAAKKRSKARVAREKKIRGNKKETSAGHDIGDMNHPENATYIPDVEEFDRQPYRILGGAIAGVFRHHKEQLKRVNWKKLAVPAAAIFIPVVVAFFAGWAFGASR